MKTKGWQSGEQRKNKGVCRESRMEREEGVRETICIFHVIQYYYGSGVSRMCPKFNIAVEALCGVYEIAFHAVRGVGGGVSQKRLSGYNPANTPRAYISSTLLWLSAPFRAWRAYCARKGRQKVKVSYVG